MKSYNVILLFFIGKSSKDLPVECWKLITEYSVSLASKNELKVTGGCSMMYIELLPLNAIVYVHLIEGSII